MHHPSACRRQRRPTGPFSPALLAPLIVAIAPGILLPGRTAGAEGGASPVTIDASRAVFDRTNRDLQLVDDAAAAGGRALELKFRGRSVEKADLQVAVTPPLGPLQHGFHRVRARLRMQGLAGSLGTGITLAVRGAAADGKPLGGPAIAARTFYLADF